ncbi:DHH family phosphoesterase, partial [Haemophilus influenzae]|uniref:DHH family phosphoesterase n=1 Tax=Haemophilus influenzae TaxID=727 RepID=UPI0034DD69C3
MTVDNGVAGHEAIALAQSMGVDVIVTDHHSIPETLPDAYAIVHPEHPDADYPFKYLAGCGVAFKLACEGKFGTTWCGVPMFTCQIGFTDGYGPNASVYKYFIEQEGISLIVTVDNGVA